jgi:hypothetical protein
MATEKVDRFMTKSGIDMWDDVSRSHRTARSMVRDSKT